MRKVITWIIVILVVMWLFGGCDSCGSCNDCSDCSGGCNLVRCDESCKKEYKGKVKFIIHKWDGSEITVEGKRESDKKDTMINFVGDNQTFGNYTPYKRVGYMFGGLYYTKNGQSKTVLDYDSYYDITEVNFQRLWEIKDGETVDLYETWHKRVYEVRYVSSTNSNYYTTYSYNIDSNIELSQNIQYIFSTEAHDRKTLVGYTAFYTSKENELVEFEWTFGGKIDEALIVNHFENTLYTNNCVISVKQNWVADKVKVELNFLYVDGNDNQILPKEITVGYDEDLTKYFTEEVTAQNVEFMGWYLDSTLTTPAPKEISKDYETTPLQLYAKHKEFKSIKIDLQNGNPPVDARVYSDNTISIDMGNNYFYGLSDTTSMKKLPYAVLVEGETYYATYYA